MKKILVALFSSFFINACAMDMMQTHPYQSTLYMQTADGQADAKAAINNGQKHLLGYDQRGLKVPGVKSVDLNQVQKNCSVIYIEGMGDTIRNEEQREQRKKVLAYSLSYNLEIINSASCQ